MFERIAAILAVRMRWVLYACVIGAAAFVAVQQLLSKGSQDIVAYVGAQVVDKGQYNPALRPWIGWGVHVAVSYFNSLLYCILAYVPFAAMQSAARVGYGALLAVLLAWITGMLTSPAIALAISLFAGNGIPKDLPKVNLQPGPHFWMQLAFFTICYLFIVFIPMFLHARAEQRDILAPDPTPEELTDPDKPITR